MAGLVGLSVRNVNVKSLSVLTVLIVEKVFSMLVTDKNAYPAKKIAIL